MSNGVIMKPHFLKLLRCPSCQTEKQLSFSIFKEGPAGEIIDGVVWCAECLNWYPVENALLEFLPYYLAYQNDRAAFWKKYEHALKTIGLSNKPAKDILGYELQRNQQAHSDWFADNTELTYSSYELTPFWLAADEMVFEAWRKSVSQGKWLLDVGCAQGRSTFKWMDLDINIVAFDISKKMVRQAIDNYQASDYRANAFFFIADATAFPLFNESFDYILLYGVLHHLAEPLIACKEIDRVLKPGGYYFGQENNKSAFRIFFDLLQKINPAWHEEAGPEHLFSKKKLELYFKDTGIKLETRSSIFFPPHIINFFSENTAYKMLMILDKIGQSISFLKNNGGVIIIQGTKHINKTNI